MSLTLYIGPMRAGKTTELIREAGRYSAIGKTVLKINHSLDTRYGTNSINSHSGLSMKSESMSTMPETIPDEDVIIIDEGNFFTGLVDFCVKAVETAGKTVIVAGLDSDFKREKFGEIQDLIRYCDTVVKLKAYCMTCRDGTLGIFSKRLDSTNNDQVSVGNEYISVCRKCYNL